MAYVAMRGSAAVNGVSRLHGDVSQEIVQSVFPRWPTAQVPIGHERAPRAVAGIDHGGRALGNAMRRRAVAAETG